MDNDKRKEIRDVARNAYVTGYETGFKEGKKEAKRFALALGVWVLVVVAGFMLIGCAPYAQYQHISRPDVANDGYDLGCVGLEHVTGRLELSGAVCENFARPSDSAYAVAGIKLNLGRD